MYLHKQVRPTTLYRHLSMPMHLWPVHLHRLTAASLQELRNQCLTSKHNMCSPRHKQSPHKRTTFCMYCEWDQRSTRQDLFARVVCQPSGSDSETAKVRGGPSLLNMIQDVNLVTFNALLGGAGFIYLTHARCKPLGDGRINRKHRQRFHEFSAFLNNF